MELQLPRGAHEPRLAQLGEQQRAESLNQSGVGAAACSRTAACPRGTSAGRARTLASRRSGPAWTTHPPHPVLIERRESLVSTRRRWKPLSAPVFKIRAPVRLSSSWPAASGVAAAAAAPAHRSLSLPFGRVSCFCPKPDAGPTSAGIDGAGLRGPSRPSSFSARSIGSAADSGPAPARAASLPASCKLGRALASRCHLGASSTPGRCARPAAVGRPLDVSPRCLAPSAARRDPAAWRHRSS